MTSVARMQSNIFLFADVLCPVVDLRWMHQELARHIYLTSDLAQSPEGIHLDMLASDLAVHPLLDH